MACLSTRVASYTPAFGFVVSLLIASSSRFLNITEDYGFIAVDVASKIRYFTFDSFTSISVIVPFAVVRFSTWFVS